MKSISALQRVALVAMCILMVVVLAACGPKKQFTAGTYTATGEGYNGPILVEVTFTKQEISSVKILENTETQSIAAPAFERIPAAVVKDQTLAVDIVSGASYTSDAILDAIKECVKKAGGNVEALMKKR